MPRADPPQLPDAETAAAVRRVFDYAGYTAPTIQERLGTTDRALAEGPDRPVYLRRLGEDDPLGILVRLFLLDVAVEGETAERVLGAETLKLFRDVGLLTPEQDTSDATVRIVPHEHLFIASDRAASGHADHVAAVHGPSATLSHLTIRRQIERALDVGTGNGIQALLAAAHAESVVATDINERALAFAAFNAALNGIENIEFRSGSFFEPVAAESFDLVVTNPPYVISPESSFLFRDSGLPKDAVSEQVARALPAHVAEGGFGSVMVSWVLQDEADPTARPASWVEGSGCDALIVYTGSDVPLSIAAQWNRDVRPDATAYAEAIDRWVEYFAKEGIREIAFGCIIVRRRVASGVPHWIRTTQMPARHLERAGEQLERMFAVHDYLVGLADERALLDERLRVADDVAVEQQLRLGEQGWQLRAAEMSITRGMRYTAELDDVTTALVLRLDGTRTVREALPAPDNRHTREALDEMGTRVARQMLEVGFLQRA
jgi:methylase of polypeptide subunit release factors